MPAIKKNNKLKVEIGIENGKEWTEDKLSRIKDIAKDIGRKRTPNRVLRNQFLSVKYKMEAYAESDEKRLTRAIPLDFFLDEYLNILQISFRKFAQALDINDANLRKYIYGERKFNADLARKFGHFFHNSPVTWMKVYQLNDLVKLRTETVGHRYDKYDFTKVAGNVNVLSESTDKYATRKTNQRPRMRKKAAK